MPRRRLPRIDPRVLALVPLVPVPALAAGREAIGTLPLVLRAGGSLIAVIALIGALAWMFRRLRGVRPSVRPRGELTALGRLGLGGRREVRLVQVRDRVLVLGVTEDSVSLLTELAADAEATPPEVADTVRAPEPALRVLQKLTSSP